MVALDDVPLYKVVNVSFQKGGGNTLPAPSSVLTVPVHVVRDHRLA